MRVPVKEDDMSALRRRRILRHLALAVTLGAATLPGATATAAEPGCQTVWGSLIKRQAPRATGEVTDVRSGRHACYDRLVIDLGPGEQRPGFRVEYVDAVQEPGSGAVVPLRGGARLRVIVQAPAYDEQGRPTYRPADKRELADVSAYDAFRQVALAGTYEGATTLGVGVRARLPMRVFTLADADGGSRVVLDVAHQW